MSPQNDGGTMALAREDKACLLRAGNANCGGCGMSVALQLLGRALVGRALQFVLPPCCAWVTGGSYPYSAYGTPVMASTLGSVAAVASGMSTVARLNSESTRVIGWAGDGATYDIGLASLSGAAERNEDVLFICYDNEIYGNTGGQRSSATPAGAITATTPAGKIGLKKDIFRIMMAHRIPYAATVSLAHPEDAVRKMRHAAGTNGFRFLHILAPCPTGWKADSSLTVHLVRIAVESGLFPVCECFNGRDLVINVEPGFSEAALRTYFASQGRFRGLSVDISGIQVAVSRHWEELRRLSLPYGDGRCA